METVVNPYRELSADITPLDFEKFCMETLKAYAAKENLQDFVIKHNQKVETHDSTYQIDVLAEYTALGCKNTLFVECKKHTHSIRRSTVTDLYTKLQSSGAQKGLIISTAGFQSDAVKFAGEHGIALWQICDRIIKRISASASPCYLSYMELQLAAEAFLPKHFMLEWDCKADYPYHELYPTPDMYNVAYQKASMALRNNGYR